MRGTLAERAVLFSFLSFFIWRFFNFVFIFFYIIIIIFSATWIQEKFFIFQQYIYFNIFIFSTVRIHRSACLRGGDRWSIVRECARCYKIPTKRTLQGWATSKNWRFLTFPPPPLLFSQSLSCKGPLVYKKSRKKKWEKQRTSKNKLKFPPSPFLPPFPKPLGTPPPPLKFVYVFSLHFQLTFFFRRKCSKSPNSINTRKKEKVERRQENIGEAEERRIQEIKKYLDTVRY